MDIHDVYCDTGCELWTIVCHGFTYSIVVGSNGTIQEATCNNGLEITEMKIVDARAILERAVAHQAIREADDRTAPITA